MASEAVLRAIAESGDVIVDPSEDALFMMLEDIEAGEGTFLIVESLCDASGQTYIQTSRNDDGSYIVEYRDGVRSTWLARTGEMGATLVLT